MAEDCATPDLWNSLEGLGRHQVYEKASSLFEQGSPAQGVYMILKGEVRVWMPEAGRLPRVLASAGPGTMLGLSEAICEGTHKLSALAVSRAEVVFVPRTVLMELLQNQHELCMQIVRMLSEDLHALYHRFQTLHIAGSRQRHTGSDGTVQ